MTIAEQSFRIKQDLIRKSEEKMRNLSMILANLSPLCHEQRAMLVAEYHWHFDRIERIVNTRPNSDKNYNVELAA